MNYCNPYCAVCHLGINTVNGRYCTRLNKNVEYAEEPPCNE